MLEEPNERQLATARRVWRSFAMPEDKFNYEFADSHVLLTIKGATFYITPDGSCRLGEK